MGNFYQRGVARESAGSDIIPDNTELPINSVEGVLSEVASDTAVIDAQDSEAALLAEDATETDAQFEQVDSDIKAADAGEEGVEEDMSEETAEQIDVAQESLRKRWGLNHRQTIARESYGRGNRRIAARESLWDDIKAFFRRIYEWLKAQGRKIKDRWINFHNQGKSIQARSKKFDAQIRALGAKDKDEIKGSFIKSLSVGGSFIGGNVTELNSHLTRTGGLPTGIENMQKTAAAAVDEVIAAVARPGAKGGNIANLVKNAAASHIGDYANAGVIEELGNRSVKVEGTGDDWNISFIDSEESAAGDVPTPALPLMHSINTFYNKMGIEVEKRAKAYEKVNSTREKFEDSIEKLLNKIDKIDAKENEDLVAHIRAVRTEISRITSTCGVLERVQANTITCLTSGVNGYLSAAIGAYKKSK